MNKILNCVCGEKPIDEIYTCGMGDFSYRIYCPKCKKQVDYTMYVKNYKEVAINEWNHFARFNENKMKNYCKELIKMGCPLTKEEYTYLIKYKFNISETEANIYVEEYIEGMRFRINCDFFGYRYQGILAKDYMPLVQEEFGLSPLAIKNYHESFLEHMEETNGRYLEEGVDYRENKKEKTLRKIFEKDPNKR